MKKRASLDTVHTVSDLAKAEELYRCLKVQHSMSRETRYYYVAARRHCLQDGSPHYHQRDVL